MEKSENATCVFYSGSEKVLYRWKKILGKSEKLFTEGLSFFGRKLEWVKWIKPLQNGNNVVSSFKNIWTQKLWQIISRSTKRAKEGRSNEKTLFSLWWIHNFFCYVTLACVVLSNCVDLPCNRLEWVNWFKLLCSAGNKTQILNWEKLY